MKYQEVTLSGWGQSNKTLSKVVRPERQRDIALRGIQGIARGCGRAFGDAAVSSQHMVISMVRLNRFLSFDQEKGVLRAEAGATVQDIVATFVPRGWMLPVTPDTQHATLGGCAAADIHGLNHPSCGTFGKHVKEMELFLPDGTKRKCSPSQNPSLFWSTIGGLGLTGVISELTLQLVPIETAYVNINTFETDDIKSACELLKSPLSSDPYASVWIHPIDYKRCLVKTASHASLKQVPEGVDDPLRSKPFRSITIPPLLFSAKAARAISRFLWNRSLKKPSQSIQSLVSYFYPTDHLHYFYRIYGKKGGVHYQCVLPDSSSLEKMIERVRLEKIPSTHISFKRLGAEGLGYLSFPQPGFALSIHFPIRHEAIYPFLDQLDHLVADSGGRVNISEDSRMNYILFRKMYPRYQDWLIEKRKIDPENSMISDLSRRLHMGKEL